jgi:hypothetical protein
VAAIIQNIAGFPFFVQVAMGIWIVLIIIAGLAMLTCLGFMLSGQGRGLEEVTFPLFVGLIWSIIGMGLTYLLGVFL